jgi:hypothetical protein
LNASSSSFSLVGARRCGFARADRYEGRMKYS